MSFPGHSRGTEHRGKAVANSHERSTEPQVNNQMARPAMLDVEELRGAAPSAGMSSKLVSSCGQAVARPSEVDGRRQMMATAEDKRPSHRRGPKRQASWRTA